jgi:hypothetical protein
MIKLGIWLTGDLAIWGAKARFPFFLRRRPEYQALALQITKSPVNQIPN